MDQPKPTPHPDQDGDIFFETEEYPAEEFKVIKKRKKFKSYPTWLNISV